MKDKKVEQIKIGNVQWTVDSARSAEFMDRFLPRISDHSGVEFFKRARVCEGLHLRDALGENKDVFVRCYSSRARQDNSQTLLPEGGAEKAWDNARRLEQLGIPAPSPVAFGEIRSWGIASDCFLVFEHLPGALTLSDQLAILGELRERDTSGSWPIMKKFAGELGDFLGQIHSRGVVPGNLSPATIFYRPGVQPHFFLGDTAKISFDIADEKIFLDNLAGLLARVERLSVGAELCALENYRRQRGLGIPLKKLARETNLHYAGILRHEAHAAALRSLRESGEQRVISVPERVMYLPNEVTEKDVRLILMAHDEIARSGGEALIKKDRKIRLTRVDNIYDKPVAVKEFIYGGVKDLLKNALRLSPARRAWRNARQFRALNIPTPRPLALVEDEPSEERARAFVITEFLEDYLPLNRYLAARRLKNSDKSRFFASLAKFIGGVFKLNVLHRDLKASNILIRETKKGWDYSLIDLESAKFSGHLSISDFAKRLAELNMSVPKDAMSMKSRLVFLEMIAARTTFSDRLEKLLDLVKSYSAKRNWSVVHHK